MRPTYLRHVLTLLSTMVGVSILVYGGYCYGWWGRGSLALQYLFQCHCPPASEAVRYAPFIVISSACLNPSVDSVAPNQRHIVVSEYVSEHSVERRDVLIDLVANERSMLGPNKRAVSLFVADELIVQVQLQGTAHVYALVDLQTGASIPLPTFQAYQPSLPDDVLHQLRQADHVMVYAHQHQRFILALANDYRQQPEQNLVIDPGDAREYMRLIEELRIAGIPYEEVPLPFGVGPQPLLEPRLYARNGLLWATADGIGVTATDQGIVDTAAFLGSTRDFRFMPVAWVLNDRAVVYERGQRYVIDNFYAKWLPVPQPVLLLNVP